MNRKLVLSLFACFACTQVNAAPLQVSALLSSQPFELKAVPVGSSQFVDLQMQAFSPYAEGAQLLLAKGDEFESLTRSTNRHYLGTNENGTIRAALWADADGSNLRGVLFAGDGSYELRYDQGQWRSVAAKSLIPEGANPSMSCGNKPQLSGAGARNLDPLDLHTDHFPDASTTAVLNPPVRATLATRTARVAFDIDASAMQKKFSNNNTTANNYMAQLITAMNAAYDAPLNVQLLVGTVLIRTSGSDPYAGLTSTNDQLTRVAIQWRDNHSAIQRSFVMLISGAQSNGCSASGLAWVDAYCRTGTAGSTNVFGSYSANQLFHTACTNIPISNDASLVAHELGHNFGANHTHCTTSGGAFLDNCEGAEAGCYSGATSCPAGGGTLMSYCNNLSGCSASIQFHPVHISLITPKTNTAFSNGCFQAAGSGTNLIFANGFE
jgi:hypothetical protein